MAQASLLSAAVLILPATSAVHTKEVTQSSGEMSISVISLL